MQWYYYMLLIAGLSLAVFFVYMLAFSKKGLLGGIPFISDLIDPIIDTFIYDITFATAKENRNKISKMDMYTLVTTIRQEDKEGRSIRRYLQNEIIKGEAIEEATYNEKGSLESYTRITGVKWKTLNRQDDNLIVRANIVVQERKIDSDTGQMSKEWDWYKTTARFYFNKDGVESGWTEPSHRKKRLSDKQIKREIQIRKNKKMPMRI